MMKVSYRFVSCRMSLSLKVVEKHFAAVVELYNLSFAEYSKISSPPEPDTAGSRRDIALGIVLQHVDSSR